MVKWMIRLKGAKFDLEELPSRLNSSELTIKEENGTYYLESSDFDSLISADDVRNRSHKIIEIINGTMKLDRNNFGPISEDGVTRIEDDGKRHHYVNLKGSIKASSRLGISRIEISENGIEKKVDINKQNNQIESWIKLAKTNKEVYDALHFYQDDTWASLYKTYEVIKDDMGGDLKSKGWVTKKEFSRFTQTAQSRDALGDSARHASKKFNPPSEPMEYNEARALMRQIIMYWMKSKI